MKSKTSFIVVCAAFLASTSGIFAQFSPGPNPITGTVGAQTLSSGTGIINIGGAINVSGGTTGLNMTGTSTLNNNGTIQASGSGRAIDSNSGSANLTITNTGSFLSNTTDAFRINTAGTSISLTNSGTISSSGGGEAIDWAAITTGSNTLTNQIGGNITAVGSDAVRPGQNGIVINAGTITATPTGTTSPSGSDGIDLRTNKAVSVTNTGTITGRHGIATDGANTAPSSLTVNNNAGTIQAINGSGINVDGVFTGVTANVTNLQGATIKGGLTAAATDGDGDGIDVDGVLTLNNSGDVFGLGAKGLNNPEGIAAGGGGITNTSTGQIIGFSTAPNGDTSKVGSGILIDDSNGGNAIAATTVTNSGLVRGETGFGIKMIGTFADTVTNNAGGIIRGAGAGATIQTGAGGDTVTNRGTITSDTGNAIDLEAGDDSLVIEGSSASITGNVSGGTGTNTLSIDPGAGSTFSYSDSLSNFNSVAVMTGHVILSGASTYSGNTTVSGTLSVTNTGGSATGTGNVVINSTGTLKGTGSIGGNVALANGGVIAPGLSPGTLNIDGSLDMVDGSHFAFELGTLSDLLDIGGALNFTGGGTAIFDILNTGSMGSGTDYTLMNYASVSGLSLSNLAFGATPAGFAGQFTIGSNALTLHVDAVPEPSRALLGMLGLALVAFRRRRA